MLPQYWWNLNMQNTTHLKTWRGVVEPAHQHAGHVAGHRQQRNHKHGISWLAATIMEATNVYSPPCTTTTTTVLQPFFRDHPGKPVPEENFWTLWCKGRLREADTPTIRLGDTPSGLTSAHLHHPPYFFYGPDTRSALPPNQPCQSTEGN